MPGASGKAEVDLSRLRAPLEQWLGREWAGAEELQVDQLGTPRASGHSNETGFLRVRWRDEWTPGRRGVGWRRSAGFTREGIYK